MRYLHFSVFLGNIKRHGGTKRSEQLAEELQRQGAESKNPYIRFKQSFFLLFKHPFVFIDLVLFGLFLCLKKGLSIRGLVKFSLGGIQPVCMIKSYRPATLIHETAPGISIPFMHYMKWKKLKYIAVPHNVEFMVPAQKDSTFRNNAYLFSAEIEGYRNADAVWVISKFDASVLSCLDVKSKVCPYYPIERDVIEYKNVSHLRRNNQNKSGFLLLGTVSNKPTYDGILEFINKFNQKHLEDRLIIAGYGTEVFSNYSSQFIEVKGSIDEAALHDLLLNVRALIVNHPQTTGFLTRIIEFNLCNIPILVVSSYQQAVGLEEYGVFCKDINYQSEQLVVGDEAGFRNFKKIALPKLGG